MLDKADYLRVGRRSSNCAVCGKPLTVEGRHLSILIDAEDVPPEAPETVRSDEPLEVDTPPDAEPLHDETAVEDTTEAKGGSAPDSREEEEPGFRRFDYCPECWQKIKDRAYFSFWVGRVPEDAEKGPRRLNRADRNVALLALFDSLIDRVDEETDHTPHLFFLAHLLMKYKMLKWQETVAEPETGRALIRFARSDSDETVDVPEIEMADELILEIRREVEEYLKETTGQDVAL